MKSSKELLRSHILRNINLFWGSKKLDRQDRVIRMLVENLVNELYLLQNSIDDISIGLLERLAAELTPRKYTSIRTAHSIAHITPDAASFFLSRKTTLFLNKLPVEIAEQGFESLPFTPIVDVELLGLEAHLFKGENWNSYWIGLEIHPELDTSKLNLQDLSFYLEFDHLQDDHLYYELLPYTQWKAQDEHIKMRQGYNNPSLALMHDFDQSILDYYHNSFLSVDQSLPLDDLACTELPEGECVNKEKVIPTHSIEIQFPHHFAALDLEHLIIHVNAFPVSNKRFKALSVKHSSLHGVSSLAAGKAEHYLGIENVSDNKKTGKKQRPLNSFSLFFISR